MPRFYWTLGVAIVITGAAWTVSGLGQSLPGIAQPPAPGLPPAPFLPTSPIFVGRPPPPPMSMAHPYIGVLPFPPPPMPGQDGAGQPSIAEVCLDVVAGRAAMRAYLKARLDLDDRQLATWQDYENAAVESEADERQACAGLAAKPADQTIAQRMDTTEQMLARRLAQLRKVGAPLRQVIAVLSPNQLRFLERSMPLMAF